MLALALALALVVAAFVVFARANEVFALRVRDGVVRVARGRPPARLLAEIGDVVARQPVVGRALIRVVVEDRRPALRARGDVPPETLQRLRNVVGLWPLAKLRGR